MTMVSLCWSLVLASIRGQMQYRLNFLFDVGFGLVFQGFGFVFVWIVLGQFDTVGGWTLGQIALLYGMRLTAHGMWTVSFSRLFAIDEIVRQGEHDRVLLRPMPAMLQLMFSSFRMTTLGDLIGGLVILGIAIGQVDVDWSPAKAMLLVAALIAGAMLDGAFQLGPAAFTFRFLETISLRVVFDNIFSNFGGYPVSIFERPTRVLLTYLVPMAFMAWVPATVLLDRTDELPFPVWIAWCSPVVGPVVGPVLLAGAAWLFRRESRHYQSAGS